MYSSLKYSQVVKTKQKKLFPFTCAQHVLGKPSDMSNIRELLILLNQDYLRHNATKSDIMTYLWVCIGPLTVGAHDIGHDVVVTHQQALLRRV